MFLSGFCSNLVIYQVDQTSFGRLLLDLKCGETWEIMENALQRLLRSSSEDLKVAFEVDFINEHGLASSPARSKRVLAVVVHRKDEAGSVLILKHKSGPSIEDLSIEVAYPISGKFSFSVAQATRATSDLHAFVVQSASTLNQSGSELTLTIKYELAAETRSHSFITRDTQGLQSFTAECRRLKNIFIRNEFKADFSWLSFYTQESFTKSFSSPTDLRMGNTPLHTRLSPASAGLPGDDGADIDIIREHWIYNEAIEEASTGSLACLSIRIGTFNVNGKMPSQDLSPWLRPMKYDLGSSISISHSPLEIPSDLMDQRVSSSPGASSVTTLAHESLSNVASSSEPDLLVLGFQELDLSTEALLYATSTIKEDAWVEAIFAGLGEKGILYEKLASKQLVGMLIIAIVKKSCLPCFGDIKFSVAGAGIMGVMGNKGATAIRMSFTPIAPHISASPTVLTFVNAHLAAFDEMVERRNFDFHDLSRRLVFHLTDGLDSDANAESETSGKVFRLFESDVLFWMGDLNYRIDLTDGDIRELLSSSLGIPLLLKYDQLKSAITSGKAFLGFSEHEIAYMPSYRYMLNTSYTSEDALGYDRKRKPAWTDRILHMPNSNVSVRQCSYCSHPEIMMSDHRPVSADFQLTVMTVDRERREIAASRLYRELWGVEHSSKMPKMKLQSTVLDFGKVYYGRQVRRTLVIRNGGEMFCFYRFVAAGAQQPISPPWLTIDPAVGLLRPNGSTTITVTAFVDNSSASRLNLAPPSLDCTLILHTALGKDYFISVNGEYQYTCFANKLSRLTRLPGPVRAMKSPNDGVSARQSVNAPREIMKLINWLMTHVTDPNDLFNGPPEGICMTIRECLDTGDEFPSLKSREKEGPQAAAVSGTLVQLLDSLIDPVVPAYLHSRCLQVTSRDEAFELLDDFPPESVNVWISLTAFLHYMSQQKVPSQPVGDQADMSKRLATVFAPILLRDDATGAFAHVSPVGKRNFLLYFIG